MGSKAHKSCAKSGGKATPREGAAHTNARGRRYCAGAADAGGNGATGATTVPSGRLPAGLLK